MQQGRSVFILDDDADFRDGLAEALRAEGYTVREAGDAREIDAEVLGQSDLLLLDLALPATDGFGMLQPLARLPRPPGVIFISGSGEELLRVARDLARASGLDVLGFLEKPVELEDLLRLMRQPSHVRAASRQEAQHSCARIRQALKNVLATRTLSVMFQPLVDANDLSFVGAEALLGNELAGFGAVRPPDIIAAAHETPEMLIDLSYQVLEAAARLCATWTAAGWDGQVSVNMPLEVLLGPDAVPEIVALVKGQGIAPQKVILELTEDALYDHSTEALSALARLRLAGFGLALDDVGQRQSGLMQLANLPVTEIKIDLELMRHAREWVKPRSIIASLAALGHQLGLKVVAEGVETAEDLARARCKGIDYIQGYLISPKRPAEDIMAMLGSLPSATSSLAEVQRVTV